MTHDFYRDHESEAERVSTAPRSAPRNATRAKRVDLEEPRKPSALDPADWVDEAWVALERGFRRDPSCPSVDPHQLELWKARYVKRYRDGTAMQWLKYHTSYIFAYGADQQELPPPPCTSAPVLLSAVQDWDGERPGRFVGGELGRWLQQLMARARGGCWKSRRVCFDIQMSKLGMPAAPESFVKETLTKHQVALTRPVESVEDPSEVHALSEVKRSIDEIVRQIFGGRGTHFDPWGYWVNEAGRPAGRRFTHRDTVPSLRASHESKLQAGGALGHLLRGFNETLGSWVLDSDSLYGMVERTRVMQGKCSCGIWPRMGPCPRHSAYKEIRFLAHEQLVQDFQDFVDSQWRGRLDEKLQADPCPILEPLKVRVITKGESAEYYRAIEIQKFMHGLLKRHPVFEYIGHPIDDESWLRCFGRGELPPGKFFVSGDYKAATDNLRPELSLYAWERICAYARFDEAGWERPLLQTDYYRLGAKCLCGHQLHYPDGTVVDQTWGQLMGSPMSFPILCLVNAAATCASQHWRFSDSLTMKVNGDDIAFISDDEGYTSWKYVTGVCGLEASIGKNYTSREFLIMNSELRRPPIGKDRRTYEILGHEGAPEPYDRVGMEERHCFGVPYWDVVTTRLGGDWRTEIRWRDEPTSWRHEGFLNQSILYHRVKKGVEAGSQKDVYWTDLQSLSHESLRGIPVKQQASVMSTFIHQHRKVLAEAPSFANWYFPTALGGIGLAIPADRSLRVATMATQPSLLERQLKQAAYLACNPAARLRRITRTKPVEGFIGSVLREVQKLSDSQVRPSLRTKPLLREQKTMLGGRTFLGYLIQGYAGGQEVCQCSNCQGPSPCDVWVDSRLGPQGELRSETGSSDLVHNKEARYLVTKYQNWLSRAGRSSLHPMGIENVAKYQEHLEMFSHLSLLEEDAVGRAMD